MGSQQVATNHHAIRMESLDLSAQACGPAGPKTRCVEILSVVVMFGLLDRCNDGLETQLSTAPLSVAQKAAGAGSSWSPGKHRSQAP